jgi:hypothetical protein
MKKHSEEFKKFDEVMGGLLAVPYRELQKELAKEQKKKARKKKREAKNSTSRGVSRDSGGGSA